LSLSAHQIFSKYDNFSTAAATKKTKKKSHSRLLALEIDNVKWRKKEKKKQRFTGKQRMHERNA
jgi:hypothetical protein